MNKRTFTTLEFHKITERLAEHAVTEDGKELCRKLTPSTDLSEITLSQQQTQDAFVRALQKPVFSFSSVKPVIPSLKRLEIGGVLRSDELLHIAGVLQTAATALDFDGEDPDKRPHDTLTEFFDALDPLPSLCKEITRCIPAEDEIADDASPELAEIRRKIRRANDKIKSELNHMVNSSLRTYLQDAVITMRNGRYCLPVKAEYRNQVQGMIHDQSSTGSTFFIEPASIVRLNNDLKELALAEQDAIEAILASLSQKVADCAPMVLADYETLIRLDFIFAKARLAEKEHATPPIYHAARTIQIRKARHPLLDPQGAVPIDLPIGEDYTQLIVTGPNTGGKTVSLKTLGLLCLMGQAGLHIPAGDRSELCVFRDIFADIGDEQSIEQSLSTFSSHMKNITYILKHADNESLVLLDELCAGTDPTEGAALATSILSVLKKRGTMTMATTHYSELKIYALTEKGVENASCEFNVETLSPTYRLLIGVPGKSNAFAISEKLGLAKSIIEDAAARLSGEEENFEDMLGDLEAKRIRMEDAEVRTAKLMEDAEKKNRELDNRLSHTRDQKDKILEDARQEATRILREAKETADASIRAIQKYGNDTDAIRKMEKERTKLRESIQKTERSRATKKPATKGEFTPPKTLRIGDNVKVVSMNMKGTVHTLPDAKGNLTVQMGIMQYKVNKSDLILLPDAEASYKKTYGIGKKSYASTVKVSKSSHVSSEINLIGRRVDEAIAELDKYLDDAYLAHLSSVRIVHGKGTGALRSAIHTYLKSNPHVASYRGGEFGEGDAGVTIAEFEL